MTVWKSHKKENQNHKKTIFLLGPPSVMISSKGAWKWLLKHIWLSSNQNPILIKLKNSSAVHPLHEQQCSVWCFYDVSILVIPLWQAGSIEDRHQQRALDWLWSYETMSPEQNQSTPSADAIKSNALKWRVHTAAWIGHIGFSALI